jgi:hypothetical protein
VPGPRPAAGWRRLAAGGVDDAVVAAYIALLALVGTLGRAAGGAPRRHARQAPAWPACQPPGWWRAVPAGSLLRSAVKIAVPWELAHTGVWNSLAWPGPEAPVNVVLFSVANGLLVVYVVMLFVGARRPPYDRLAGSIVSDQLGR